MRLILLSLFALLLGSARAQPAPTYTNPIIPGFNPDPSLCRVGDDYYLATSTFEYFPGVPIYHSRDLVNWEIIGHALHRPAQLDLTGVECSNGIYAPTLRYHAGTYYMITTLVGATGRKGNFIVTAKNPAGPWSDPHWIENAPGIDPSLFFDEDGRAYYCGNGRPQTLVHEKHRLIWIQEIDLQEWKLFGPRTELDSGPYFANQQLGPVNNFEGPHLYRKDGLYYLMLSHGGTSLNHTVSIWMSPSPLGPWEGNPANPILTHRADHPPGLTSTGHADLVQTQNGEWWLVALGVRSETAKSPMGRETLLAPVDWSGRWPIVSPGTKPGRIQFEHARPNLPPAPAQRPRREEFTGSSLDLHWNFIRTPVMRWWDLQARAGWLRLSLRPEEITELAQPTFLGQRITATDFQVTTRVDLPNPSGKECAGLAVLRARDSTWLLVVESQGEARVAAVYANGISQATWALASAASVELRITGSEGQLDFAVAGSDGAWQQLVRLPAEKLATASGGRFTGSMAGLYASARGANSTSTADFDWFELTTNRSSARP